MIVPTPTLASLAGRRALTVCQPYASALLHILPDGRVLKTVENRTWPTKYRGPLLIHAGKSVDWLDDLASARFRPLRHLRNSLPFGAILGQVTLVDCVDYETAVGIDPEFSAGPFCWVMDDPILFDTPIPFLGSQGLWNVLSITQPSARAAKPSSAVPQASGLKTQDSTTAQLDLFTGLAL